MMIGLKYHILSSFNPIPLDILRFRTKGKRQVYQICTHWHTIEGKGLKKCVLSLHYHSVASQDIIRGDLPCPGASEEREKCDAGPCPAWTPWTSWSECSATCGGGNRNRIRECRKGRNYGECEGLGEEVEECAQALISFDQSDI